MVGFGDAVASAGPYANNPHLAPDRKPHQNRISFYGPGAGQKLKVISDEVNNLAVYT